MFRGADPLELMFSIPALLMAITFHEFAHGYMANRLGDPTPGSYGRLTLNPIKHLDPLGAIALLTVGFGWAKPVPINPTYFRDHRKGTALVGLAGPVANILLAFVSLIFAKIVFASRIAPMFHISNNMSYFIQIFIASMISLNIGLAIFNLIPIPPLDGSKIFISILPSKWHYNILRYESYGQVILLLLLFTGMLNPVLGTLFTIVRNSLLAIVNILPI